MQIDTMNPMNEALLMIKVIALITALLAVAGFVIYLGGIAWLCFQETRRSRARRKSRPALPLNSWESATGIRCQAGGFSDHWLPDLPVTSVSAGFETRLSADARAIGRAGRIPGRKSSTSSARAPMAG